MTLPTVQIGVVNIPSVFEVDDNGELDGRCRFKGHIGRYFNYVIDHAFQNPIRNCTIHTYDEFGQLDFETGNYSGVVGDVQSQFLDISVVPVYYPLVGDKFSYSSPIIEDTMTMATFYNMSHHVKDKDLMFMFSSIPRGLWIGLIVTFLILVLLLKASYRLLEPARRTNPWWIILRAYLNQDHFLTDTIFFVTFSSFVTAVLFFALAFLKNSMSTDLVVIEKPVTIKTYQEAIDREDMKFCFTPALPEYAKSSRAPPDSFTGKIFQRKMLFEVGLGGFAEITKPMIKQEAAIVAREIAAAGISLAVLKLLPANLIDTRALLVEDKNAMKFTNVFIWRRTGNKTLVKAATFVINSLFETGVIADGYKSVPQIIVTGLLGDVSPSVFRKLSTKIQEDNVEYSTVRFRNVKYVIIAYLSSVIMITLIYILELIFKPKQKGKKKKKRIISNLEEEKRWKQFHRVASQIDWGQTSGQSQTAIPWNEINKQSSRT